MGGEAGRGASALARRDAVELRERVVENRLAVVQPMAGAQERQPGLAADDHLRFGEVAAGHPAPAEVGDQYLSEVGPRGWHQPALDV